MTKETAVSIYFRNVPAGWKFPPIARRLATLLVAAAMLVMAAGPTFAHAILIDHTLGTAPIAPDTAMTVTFRFNASLEQAFFRAILVGPGKEQRDLEVMPGKDTTEELIKLPPLKPGKYGIAYKALASDSHLTEAVLRFTVGEAQ
ncbi:MAG TPA: copper resistance protein CopC [Alphaproteobacteria bacterium]|nr:copper resistance protein CopC [Alphaproteobacteria bacterium]